MPSIRPYFFPALLLASILLSGCAQSADSADGVCSDGELRCDGAQAQRCEAGVFVTTDTCDADGGFVCQDGRCIEQTQDGDVDYDGAIPDGDTDMADGDREDDGDHAPDGDQTADGDQSPDGDADATDGDLDQENEESDCEGCVSDCATAPDGAPCDDARPCTGVGACAGGHCVAERLDDWCIIDEVCVAQNQADPQNACMVCYPNIDPGVYSPASGIACQDDELACTEDICDAGSCTHPLTDGYCLIGSACVSDGQTHLETVCLICDTENDPLAWSDADNGSPCDNQDACSISDFCQSGQCVLSEPIANDCGGWLCGPSPSACHDCGVCDGVTACKPDSRTCIDTCPSSDGLLEDAPWPMAGYCASRQGRSPLAAGNELVFNWSYTTQAPIKSEVAIGADGLIYLASDILYVLTASGAVAWAYNIGDEINSESTPLLAADGRVFVLAVDGKLHCITESGDPKWVYNSQGYVTSSPLIDPAGHIIFGSYDTYLYSVEEVPPNPPHNENYSAKRTWRYLADSAITGASPIFSGDEVVSATTDGRVFGVLRESGELVWEYSPEPETSFASAPALDLDGRILIGAQDGFLYRLNPDGTLYDRIDLGAPIGKGLAVGPNGEIVVAAGALVCLNADGGERWRRSFAAAVSSPPTVDHGGNVYLGLDNGQVVGVKLSDGADVFAASTGARVSARPVVGPDGRLYVGSTDGKLYSYRPAPSGR
jgi:outer membrane protein assembly factor BamB